MRLSAIEHIVRAHANTYTCLMSPCLAQRIPFNTDINFLHTYFIILLTRTVSKKLIYLDTHNAKQNETFCSYSFIHSFVRLLIRAWYTLDDMSVNKKKNVFKDDTHSKCHHLFIYQTRNYSISLVFAFNATHIAIERRKNAWHLNGISFPYGFCFPLSENTFWFGWQRNVVASHSFVSDEKFSCGFDYISMTFIVAPNDLHARRTFLIYGLDSGNNFSTCVYNTTDPIKHSAFFYFNICSADGIKMHCESTAR